MGPIQLYRLDGSKKLLKFNVKDSEAIGITVFGMQKSLEHEQKKE